MESDQFSQMVQQAYQEALKGADAITANAEKVRQDALRELDAAREARRVAEAEGEKMAQDYFAKTRKQLIEATRTELLRTLVRQHLETGKTPTEICVWLDVPAEFVEDIRVVWERAARFRERGSDERPPRLKLEGNPSLRYETMGRGGTVWFESREAKFDMWWEFAGGDALAIVDIPTPDQWEARTKLPRDRREKVLTFIGEQIVEDQTGGEGSFIIGENVLTIYSR
jgi:hypothetical protein